ncbi:tRNA-dihydrouridine(47) synthase [NAD(P)(+)]-like isoform X2 [Mastomys coucha]|uniref:tRNA-dihydrouridine(47) synthase [NAD(P)(+)]-like isoform X2 n=1 Tax=Mastomys coucha TaxID=35658 RepID=UPI001262938E|nr:tRNA-dihydrouridine(47) synthase [NAD(P)(+)]-like isoform X2 [Mastomys coucha]XP_031203930.1 tRNA-dihydrouridine(47) synthase [NAD(P)(+)]-like isoform X2 [Mastomys coucha]
MAEAAEAAAESGGGGDSGVGTCERGVAPIKAQYRTTKEQFHEYLDGDKQESACREMPTGDPAEPGAKRIRLEDAQENGKTEMAIESHERQVPKRARGQNKSRPHMKPAQYDKDRLCPSLLQESATPCTFGDRCRFLHDVQRYLETKPADLGPRCVLFDTFGRCPFSMTCRFAGAHLGPEGQNLVHEELVARCAQLPSVRNGLDRALQQQLRKRQVCFERAEQALCHLTQGPMPTIVPETTVAMLTPKQNSCHTQLDTVGGVGTPQGNPVPTCGPLTDEDVIRLRPCEKKRLDISGKLYLAPLTTCGNLPFRRICKRFGADVTCGEMAMCTNLLQGQMSEWALLKRHPCEDIFGVQLEGAFPDTMTKCAELLNRTIDVDFVDINVGCPIDLVYKKGGGCALMNRSAKFQQIVRGVNEVLDVPLTVKMRTGVQERVSLAHRLLPELRDWGVALVTLHGRSREQRYTRLADWLYIEQCAKVASPMPLFGNGDILSFEDANCAMQTGVAGIMVARGALLKPWLFTEIKEQRHWDISSSERLDILRDFTHYGLEHWGSDTQGVERTRRFLLEWLSFLCRYVPVGLLERLPQRINERPPYYLGRDYLETLMASQQAADWIRISEMLLGPVPPGFVFLPKHKANAYK